MFKVIKTGKRKSECCFLLACSLPCQLWCPVHGFCADGRRACCCCALTAEKEWKRMVTKVTFVGPSFTRKAPKYERFIRPTGLRFTKANVTHPELQATFQLEILGVKKNPQSTVYTSLGVITKGTVLEVNVSELGLVTNTGKVVWGKYAQVTNNPENDGVINAVLLV